MDIGEETGDHDTETVIGDRPSRMLTAGTGTEVLSRYQYLSAIRRIVQDE